MPILKDFRFSIVFLYFVYGFERLVSLALYLDSIFALMWHVSSSLFHLFILSNRLITPNPFI